MATQGKTPDTDAPGTKPGAKVVNLAAKLSAEKAYGEAVKAAITAIEGFAGSAFEQAINVAMNGPWKEWSDAQPVGAVMHISAERLASTNDPVVLELLALSDEASEAVERIRIALG